MWWDTVSVALRANRPQNFYSDNTSSFEELLETDDSVSVHHQKIQVLATEFYKTVNGLSTEIMKEVFLFNDNTSYNTRTKSKFHSRAINRSLLTLKRYIISGT